jgi:hypothetical protein
MPYSPIDPATATPVVVTLTGLTSEGETLASLREQLQLEMGNRQDITPDQWNKWINWAYKHAAGMLNMAELKHSFSFNLVVDQPFYRLPSSVVMVRSVSVVDTETYLPGGRTLDRIDDLLYRRLDEESDEPTCFFRWNRVLVFWPTPTTARAVTVDGQIRVIDLEDDTDSPILPEEFHEAIMLFAKARALRATRQFGAANLAMNDAVGIIRPLVNHEAEERATSHGRLQPIRTAAEMYRRRR